MRPRSGLAIKHGVTVANAPGTIDSDYRGEVKVLLINLGQETFTINRGDRIAQMIVAAVTTAASPPSISLMRPNAVPAALVPPAAYHERDQTMLTDPQLERYARQVILPALVKKISCCWASVMWPLSVLADLVHR